MHTLHSLSGGALPISSIRMLLSFAFFGIPSAVFWMYVSACVILVVGAARIIKEFPRERGLDKFLAFGPLFFAMPMAVFGTEHLTFTAGIAAGIPSWIPWHVFWTYAVGIAFICAALGLAAGIQARLGATFVGATLLFIVLAMHIPAAIKLGQQRIIWTVVLRDLSFSCGALAFAASVRSGAVTNFKQIIGTARVLIGITCLVYSVEHILHPLNALGVPLALVMPEWIPVRPFWAYFAAAALLFAGLSLVLDRKARLGATILGTAVLVLVLCNYLPLLIANPGSVEAVNYFFDTLLFAGAALLLAGAVGESSAAAAAALSLEDRLAAGEARLVSPPAS